MTTMAAVATEEWSAAEGRQQQPAVADVAAAVAAAAGPDQLTGSESAARGAPLGRTGCWAQPGQLVAASVAASVASVGAAEASGASVVGAEVAEQEPPHPEGALLGSSKRSCSRRSSRGRFPGSRRRPVPRSSSWTPCRRMRPGSASCSQPGSCLRARCCCCCWRSRETGFVLVASALVVGSCSGVSWAGFGLQVRMRMRLAHCWQWSSKRQTLLGHSCMAVSRWSGEREVRHYIILSVRGTACFHKLFLNVNRISGQPYTTSAPFSNLHPLPLCPQSFSVLFIRKFWAFNDPLLQ